MTAIHAENVIDSSEINDTAYVSDLSKRLMPSKGVSIISSLIDDSMHLIEYVLIDDEAYGKYYERFSPDKEPFTLIDSCELGESGLKAYSFSHLNLFQKFTPEQLKNRRVVTIYKLGNTIPVDYNFVKIFGVILGLLIGILGIVISNTKSSNRNKKELEKAEEKLGNSPTADDLAKLYRDQITIYQEAAQRKTDQSFYFAVIVMFLGTAFLAWGGYHIFTNSNGSEFPIAATVISSLGGAISAFIAKTFLDIHKLALLQMNHYYKHPVINDHLLMAQRFSDQMPDNQATREEYQKIISSTTGLVDRMDNNHTSSLKKTQSITR